MIKYINLFIFCCFLTSCSLISHSKPDGESGFYSLKARTIEGEILDFATLKNKVVLITNLAVDCGTTVQFHDLQELHKQMHGSDLVIIGFPSNDFSEIKTKHVDKEHLHSFGVDFFIMESVHLLGDNISPVFAYLTEHASEGSHGEIQFNFEKFLISKDGHTIKRFGCFSTVLSKRIKNTIDQMLKE